MIAILLKDINYEQDIRELFMAFFPDEKYTYDYDKEISYSFVIKGEKKQDNFLFCLSIKDDKIYRDFNFTVEDKGLRIDIKTDIKRNIYNIIRDYVGYSLPWGTLTGIRPTKLVMEKIESGFDKAYIKKYFSERYFLNGYRNSLCVDTAYNEYEIVKNIDDTNTYSLYIGIPFCPTICAYCSFGSYPIKRWEYIVDAYLEALIKELIVVSELNKDKRLISIYIGGGTPTSLNSVQLRKLLHAVKKYFDVENSVEFSVEAGRPDTLDYEKLAALKEYGVGRISINPQSMNERTLKIIGRSHTCEEIKGIYNMARDVGHENINMDIIAGLHGENVDDIKNTMNEIIRLKPESITVHTLSIKRAAKFNTQKDEYEKYKTYKDAYRYDYLKDMLDYAYAECFNNGYRSYYLYRQKNMAGNFENVGFAKKGYECLYNILIMEERHNIIACGASASSKSVYFDETGRRQVKRLENVKDPKLYIEKIGEIIQKKEDILGRV